MTATRRSGLRRAVERCRRGSDYGLLLWVLLGTGGLARLYLVFATKGSQWDLESFQTVLNALHADFTHAYELANSPTLRYPYPPGYFPFILTAGFLGDLTGVGFMRAIRIPPVVADLGLAWLVQYSLGRRGFSQATRLLGAALVALGPTFVAVSAFNGQIDSLTVLFPALALVVWQGSEARWRGLAAGALIGLGATIKTVPFLMLLALLPSARSRREVLTLTLAVAAVSIAILAPWLILDGPRKWAMLRYSGIPGLGSLTLLVDPDAAPAALGDTRRTLSPLSGGLYLHWRFITGGAFALLAAFMWRFRPSASTAAMLVWFTLATFAVTFTPAYYLWVLPFVLLAGHVRLTLGLWLVLVPATLVEFWARTPDPSRRPPLWIIDALYTVPMLALWAAGLVVLWWLVRRTVHERRRTVSDAAPAGAGVGPAA